MPLLEQLQLNSMLEVTQAINNNVPESDLYRIFYFISIANLRFKRIAHIVTEGEELVCKNAKELNVDEVMIAHLKVLDCHQGIINLNDHVKLKVLHENVDYIIPVSHKQRLLAYILIGLEEGEEHENDEFSFIQTLANIIMVAIENKRLGRRELERAGMQKEMEIASKVQSLLLPATLQNNEQLKTHVTYVPNKEVGGDYYDYLDLGNGKVIFCIADVSGKGMPAALLMSHFQAVLRTFLRVNPDLVALVKELNYQLLSNSGGMHFVTFFVAKIEIATGKVEFINAGHNPPVLVSNGKTTLLEAGTTIIGALDELPFVNQGAFQLHSGDCVFSYTDGVSEVKNEEEQDFEDENISKYLQTVSSIENLEEIHNDLLTALDNHRGTKAFPDDLTVYSLYWK